MSVPSFMVEAGGNDRSIIKRHLPDLFLGTAPRGLTTKASSGGIEKGPALWPASHSFVSIMAGRNSADGRLCTMQGARGPRYPVRKPFVNPWSRYCVCS